MKKQLIFVFSVLVLSTLSMAQKPACPTIKIKTDETIVTDGTTVNFLALVMDLKEGSTPVYNWSCSAGTISSGQGTPMITVETKDLAGQSLTATIDVGGIPENCSSYSSITIMIDAPTPKVILFESGNFISSDDFKRSVIHFAKDSTAPNIGVFTKSLMIVYPGKEPNAAFNVIQMKKIITAGFKGADRLFNTHEIAEGGKRDKTSYEFYIIPIGMTDPVPNPKKF